MYLIPTGRADKDVRNYKNNTNKINLLLMLQYMVCMGWGL